VLAPRLCAQTAETEREAQAVAQGGARGLAHVLGQKAGVKARTHTGHAALG